ILNPEIGIFIVNYNGRDNTLACLRSLEKLQATSCRLQVFVVDNHSFDNSVQDIKKQFPKATLIKNAENLGFVGGNNAGIKKAIKDGADYVLILNNDTLVSENLIGELLKVAQKDEKVGIVVPKIFFAAGYEFHKKLYQKNDLGRVIWYAGGRTDWQNMFGVHLGVDEVDHGQFDQEKEVDFATGCCFLAKKEVFSKIGLFDSKFFLYGEDLDLSIRALKAGFKIFYAPRAFLWHKNAGSSSSGSTLHDYYLSRNRLLLGW